MVDQLGRYSTMAGEPFELDRKFPVRLGRPSRSPRPKFELLKSN